MPWEPHNQSTNNYVFVDSSLFFKNLICKANLAETRRYQITSKGISDYNDRCIEAHLLTHMLADDKIGRTTAEFGNVICNILKVVCVMNVHKRKKILLATYDPQNSNLLDDVHFWCPRVLFHVAKLFLSKILSAHRMIIFQDSKDF